MTEREKRSEVDNLITELRQSGMPYPKTCGALVPVALLDGVLADCRRLVRVARKSASSPASF